VREAAAPFWEQWPLVDLRAADAERHARHLAAIAALDQPALRNSRRTLQPPEVVAAFMAQRAAASGSRF
jgi:hypothetical protein